MNGAWLTGLAERLDASGLNLIGVVGRARYDAVVPAPLATSTLHPPTRSIVVVGSGGGALWQHFLDYVAQEPRTRLAQRAHPLDAFCRDTVGALAPMLGDSRVFYAEWAAPIRLDFMRLAELAGIGRKSELGILVSPTFGLWFGLRAAIFTPHELDESQTAARACDGCPAPCRGVQPFDAARRACIASPTARYPDDERRYHNDRRSGRVELLARFGLEDEAGAAQ